jgi:hypothetical protein
MLLVSKTAHDLVDLLVCRFDPLGHAGLPSLPEE